MSVILQVGQCGNQIGQQFWQRTVNYAHLYKHNKTTCESQQCQCLTHLPFFNEHSEAKAILVDTEPKVLAATTRIQGHEKEKKKLTAIKPVDNTPSNPSGQWNSEHYEKSIFNAKHIHRDQCKL